MLAPCGLICENCEAYIATQANDELALQQIAAKWSKIFNTSIKIEHLLCDGCNVDGRKSYYCSNFCEIKKCVISKNLQNCGKCESFACEKLDQIFTHEPEAKTRLKT